MARKTKRRKQRLAKKREKLRVQALGGSANEPVESRTVSEKIDTQERPMIFTPKPFKSEDWTGPDGILGKFIAEEVANTIGSYEVQPNLIIEHANTEEDTARGGYANRQIMELVQNGADALSDAQNNGLLRVILTGKYLYCADDGDPIKKDGITALMFSHMSPKRGTKEIGRFGLGFKSVLGVTDDPEFMSRLVSFRFSRGSAKEKIAHIAPDAERYPVLRTPEPIDAVALADGDAQLSQLMGRYMNVVRLPLKDGAVERIQEQIDHFEAEFLLFVPHVKQLYLQDMVGGPSHRFTLDRPEGEDGVYVLHDGTETNRWRLFSHIHKLSPDAIADSRALDNAEEVLMRWAAPLDRDSEEGGRFWAFFPTKTETFISGILKAPWKLDDDRQNLLPGQYNDELIAAAANMIADALPYLATHDDPAMHLDMLPRRQRSADEEQTILLRNTLFKLLYKRALLPDQEGTLRQFEELRYPPRELMRRDASIADPVIDSWFRISDISTEWIHRTALHPQRWTFVGSLCDPEGKFSSDGGHGTPDTSFAQWLEALVKDKSGTDAIKASKVAIQTAALIPRDIRDRNSLGNIILNQNYKWVGIDSDNIFLPSKSMLGDAWMASLPQVKSELAYDISTRSALEELGIKEASPETKFDYFCDKLVQTIPSRVDVEKDIYWIQFWEMARDAGYESAKSTIQRQDNWRKYVRVRTVGGEWHPVNSVLLPGDIAVSDGSNDANVVVDTEFHESDRHLLEDLGLTDKPEVRSGTDLVSEYWYKDYERECRREFRTHITGKRNPNEDRLVFRNPSGPAPMAPFRNLSDEGKARFTDKLVSDESTFAPWTMIHDVGNPVRDPLEFEETPAVQMLKEHGRVETSSCIVSLSDVIVAPYEHREALDHLLCHENGEKIREAFDLPDTSEIPAFHDLAPRGESDPVPITDEWPGLEAYISPEKRGNMLIRCAAILVDGEFAETGESFARNENVYLVDGGEDVAEFRSVAEALGLVLTEDEVREIMRSAIGQDVSMRIHVISQLETDAERLLAAVRGPAIREDLPESLLGILEKGRGPLSGIELANAAISTYHTDALRHYRNQIKDLNPPKQWAGSSHAVSFVTSLGFSPEWAGERNRRRDPFVEVMGPYSLPKLHRYQNKIAWRLRQMLKYGNLKQESRRGMISLPTGSGKTRVAVQGIVEAMRDDGLKGGVLWVADRDELCEQAVESWHQVWASIGRESQSLRISRMWAGQPPPIPTSDLHVVVASIQTLYSKMTSGNRDYDFLRDCKLVVFDEAHRTIAATFTSVMGEMGFTPRQRTDEPFLLGLTATPYRGSNKEETRWLTNRYGSNRLDRGAFESDDPNDVIRELQNMKVLARADHERIEGGRFDLTWEEREKVGATPWLPRSAEDRLARDTERTERIVKAYRENIRDVNPEWPTLIFATSVEHAQTLSALLNADGVKARAVSGNTEPSVRRRVVEEFRGGDIKTLVNYGVFREGFDAPKTRAIIVARPVYSPNLYFQMIGRGLRGMRNGGNDRCLILDVEDNIENFERKLAFTELDWLWDR